MFKINISKKTLILKLKENRKQHRDIFLRAQEGWKLKVITLMEVNLQAARDNKGIHTYINLHEPKDQTKDYDRVLGMLEYSTDDTIELDESQYNCYMLDEWTWSVADTATKNTYL